MSSRTPRAGAPVLRLPPTRPGMAIGLFGGSFDPPHAGHLHASRTALRACGLDRVWWLVSPQNPLKRHRPPAPLETRMAAARKLARHDPKIVVTAIEAALGTRYTADLVAALQKRRPGVRFVLVVGADIWPQSHRWRRWRELVRRVPIVIVDRPGSSLPALSSRAARSFAKARITEAQARLLPAQAPPAWTFIPGPRVALSSTQLRGARL